MKLLITFFILVTSLCFSQDFWEPTYGPYEDSETHLFINNFNGVIFVKNRSSFRSTDNGNNWTEINNGLTELATESLAINSDGYIFAGTFGGVYRSINPTVSVEETESIPNTFRLLQNYPNPFNPSTTIKYSISKHTNVTLKVFDVLGSEVTALVNNEQPQGNYEIEFDPSADG